MAGCDVSIKRKRVVPERGLPMMKIGARLSWEQDALEEREFGTSGEIRRLPFGFQTAAWGWGAEG
jgi:hypothetical protein